MSMDKAIEAMGKIELCLSEIKSVHPHSFVATLSPEVHRRLLEAALSTVEPTVLPLQYLRQVALNQTLQRRIDKTLERTRAAMVFSERMPADESVVNEMLARFKSIEDCLSGSTTGDTE